jgi:hypothetical protein
MISTGVRRSAAESWRYWSTSPLVSPGMPRSRMARSGMMVRISSMASRPVVARSVSIADAGQRLPPEIADERVVVDHENPSRRSSNYWPMYLTGRGHD